MRVIPAALIALILILLLSPSQKAEADHGVVSCGSSGMKACLSAASPFVNQIAKPAGEFTYCINQRGLQYPGFRAQVQSVMARWAEELRMPGREVAYPADSRSTACHVRNDMRDDHPCNGCGAWVWTQNMPVLVEYNARTGYVRWDSTIGHEFGHLACLLDEHYWKEGFKSYILTFGTWLHFFPTVMDSGTPFLREYAPLGIWYPTDYDLDRCEETLGRDLDFQPPPPCEPCWDGEAWLFSSGWRFFPNSSCGNWFDPQGRHMWGDCNDSWNGRYVPALDIWDSRGDTFFFAGEWRQIP